MNQIDIDLRQAGILFVGVSLLLYGVFGLTYGYPSRQPVLVSLIILVVLSGVLVGSFLKQRR
jgi:hypothetical protein